MLSVFDPWTFMKKRKWPWLVLALANVGVCVLAAL
jgi:hypothetical protein